MTTGNTPHEPSERQLAEAEAELRFDEDLLRIATAVGFPIERFDSSVKDDFMLACFLEVYGDGEIVISHEPFVDDPVMREFFGERTFGGGLFGQRLKELAHTDDPVLREAIKGARQTAASVAASNLAEGRGYRPQASVAIDRQPDKTILRGKGGGHMLTLPRRIDTVIDYGPGYQGYIRVEEQLADLRAGKDPYHYIPITRGPFIFELLQLLRTRDGGWRQGII